MNLVNYNRAQHWYRCKENAWEPCYEVPSKSKPGEMRAATLRDARELHLYPSVTAVLSIIAKPELEAWKQEQAILAALTLPRQPMETTDTFARRIVSDMEMQSLKAREFGQRIHAAIEVMLNGGGIAPEPELDPYLDSFRLWAKTNIEEVTAVEKVTGNAELGYAGRLDFIGSIRGIGKVVVDFKTQTVKSNKSGKTPAFYSEWPRQMVAYAKAENVQNCLSVIVDSGEPSQVHVKQWSEFDRHWAAFQHCLAIWIDEKNYDPRKP